MSNPFAADVIAAITRHMNHDHAADTLVICRGVGGRPAATDARMDGFDADGADFTAIVDDVPVPVRISWSRPVGERAQVRPEIVRLYDESRAALGMPPRG